MQGRLVNDVAAENGVAIISLADGEAIKPILPTGIQMTLEFDTIVDVFVRHALTIEQGARKIPTRNCGCCDKKL